MGVRGPRRHHVVVVRQRLVDDEYTLRQPQQHSDVVLNNIAICECVVIIIISSGRNYATFRSAMSYSFAGACIAGQFSILPVMW